MGEAATAPGREQAFKGLARGAYRVIYADPNWEYAFYSEAGGLDRAPQAHYRCDPVEVIADLPVGELAAPDCALFLWGVWPMLRQALWLMDRWGFEYKTGGPWAKQTRTGRHWQFGTGYIFRGASEFFLVGKRGEPRLRDTPEARSVRNLIASADWLGAAEFFITAAAREHSRKPDEMVTMIETLFDGPYVELFARTRRPGWSSWGDQLDTYPARSA